MTRRSWQRLRRGAGLVATVVVLLALVLGPSAGTALVVSAPIDTPDAIVSLASHEWERLPETANVAARNPDAIVLLTLPEQVNQYNCHDCANRTALLAKAGVDPARIRILPLTSPGTHGEALATRDFLVKSGLKRLEVVTSPYHTRRSLATFETVLEAAHVAVGVVPAAKTSAAQPARWWSASYDRAYVRYEWAAVLYYRLRYGVPMSPAPIRVAHD